MSDGGKEIREDLGLEEHWLDRIWRHINALEESNAELKAKVEELEGRNEIVVDAIGSVRIKEHQG